MVAPALLLAQDPSATVSGEFRFGTGTGVAAVKAELVLDGDSSTSFSVQTDSKGGFDLLHCLRAHSR